MACACAGIVIGCVTITGLGHHVHPGGHHAVAELAGGRARADRDRRDRPGHGHADDAVVHRDGLAAGARGDQARARSRRRRTCSRSTSRSFRRSRRRWRWRCSPRRASPRPSIWSTGWEAVRLAAPAYIIPFMFIYEPSLLLIGDWFTSLTSCVSAVVGVTCLAAGLQGYLLREAPWWQRAAAARRGDPADQAGLRHRRHRPRAARAGHRRAEDWRQGIDRITSGRLWQPAARGCRLRFAAANLGAHQEIFMPRFRHQDRSPLPSRSHARRRWRRTIRRSRSGSSCRSRPAARPTSMRASSACACRKRWGSRSSSRIARAPARSSAPTRSPRARRTATRC